MESEPCMRAVRRAVEIDPVVYLHKELLCDTAVFCRLHTIYSKISPFSFFLPRDAMLCLRFGPLADHARVINDFIVLYCLSVSVSITSRCCAKTAKRRITQITHDSPGTLVFLCQRSPRHSTGVTPYGGAKCGRGRL